SRRVRPHFRQRDNTAGTARIPQSCSPSRSSSYYAAREGSAAAVTLDRALAPRDRHGGRLAVPVAAAGPGPGPGPRDDSHRLLARLLVRLPALLRGGQLRLAEDARLGVTARPRDERRRAVAEEVHVVERAVLLVEADGAVLDLVLADVVAVKVQVQRCFQFAGVGAAAGELALPPARQELLVHRQQVPPAAQDALGVGLQVGAAGNQVEVRHVGAVAVEQHDLLEAVVGERLGDVEDAADEVLEVAVDGAGEVHDVAAVAVPVRWQDEHLVGGLAAGAVGDPLRADAVHVERQVRPLAPRRARRHDAYLAQLHGVVDLRPGQLLVAVLFRGAAGHGFPLVRVERLFPRTNPRRWNSSLHSRMLAW